MNEFLILVELFKFDRPATLNDIVKADETLLLESHKESRTVDAVTGLGTLLCKTLTTSSCVLQSLRPGAPDKCATMPHGAAGMLCRYASQR